MPSIIDHHATSTTKLLNVGASSAGKTGALASLADAGFKLRILDIDNGVDLLQSVYMAPNSPYKRENARNIQYETFTDPMKSVNGKLQPAKATVWTRVCTFLDDGKIKDHEGKVVEEWGPLKSWGPEYVLCVDTVSHLWQAAMNFEKALNGRLGQQPHQSDWYACQQDIRQFFEYLHDEDVRCNVVVNCHVKEAGEENGPKRLVPDMPGKALDDKIGSYFNTVIMTKTVGSGTSEKRKIITRSTHLIELKTSNPFAVKPEYDLERGMAELFADLRGQSVAQMTEQLAKLAAESKK